tara:strand:- start:427 stop:756 length:330 start_codon:yes stop_codon:yes gene_type:complete
MSRKLYLWKIYQNENNDYDTYDSAIVVAPDEESARKIHPFSFSEPGVKDDPRSMKSHFKWLETNMWDPSTWAGECLSWASPDCVSAILIGEALPGMIEGHVVCASFNAG